VEVCWISEPFFGACGAGVKLTGEYGLDETGDILFMVFIFKDAGCFMCLFCPFQLSARSDQTLGRFVNHCPPNSKHLHNQLKIKYLHAQAKPVIHVLY
jgi:hypothetical protein